MEVFSDSSYEDPSLVRNKSKKVITSKNDELINIVNQIERLEPQFKKYEDNITKEERNALETLRNNKDIVIKPSDK